MILCLFKFYNLDGIPVFLDHMTQRFEIQPYRGGVVVGMNADSVTELQTLVKYDCHGTALIIQYAKGGHAGPGDRINLSVLVFTNGIAAFKFATLHTAIPLVIFVFKRI